MKTTHWLGCLLIYIAATLGSARAQGAEILLSDGTIIVGDIVTVAETEIRIQTAHLGLLTVPREQIALIRAAEHPSLDRAPETVADGDPDAIQSPPQAAAEAAAPTDEKPAKDWTLEIDLGLANVSGNTDEQVLNFGLRYNRETERHRFLADASYYLKISDDDVTDNKFTSGLRYDWRNPDSRWFAFAAGRYDFDEFESWQQRITAHAGPGYRIYRKDQFKWDVRAGLGGRREFGSNNDELRFEGLLATNLEWKPTKDFSLNFQTEYFPVLTELDDFRWRTTFGARYRLNDIVSLAFGALHEYQSIVDPGKERNDLRLTLGLGLDF